MMNEIEVIKKVVNLDEILFVVDLMIGQDVVNIVCEFNECLDFNGVVLIKLDGDICGGVVFFICIVVNKFIKFVGIGEKLDVIDQFYFVCMVDCIFGMGDIVFLVECVQE